MTLYKIQHRLTKLFLQKKLFYWTEKSKWNTVGSFWHNLDDVAKYLLQVGQLTEYDSGIDITDWQIVEYVVVANSEQPAKLVLQKYK